MARQHLHGYRKMPRTRCARSSARMVAIVLCAVNALITHAVEPAAEPQPDATQFGFIPPEIEDRTVFYHSFENGPAKPEINRIGATIQATPDTTPIPGINGHGYLCDPKRSGTTPFTIHSDQLRIDRPITAMVWWRLDSPMEETSCFHILSLRGKGHVATFVRGKGKWCALPEPRRIFQVHGFPGISNRNDPWSEKVWFQPGNWHHAAIVVSAASEIQVYWDGERKTHYVTRGRPFLHDDVAKALFGQTYGALPTAIDDVLIVNRTLTQLEIENYVQAVNALIDIEFPPKTNAESTAPDNTPPKP